MRAGLPRRVRSGQSRRATPGISARTQREIAAFEDSRLWPGAIAEASTRWANIVHGPARSLLKPEFGRCGIEACCPTDTHPRKLLEQAMSGLSQGSSRELLRRVEPLDMLYLSRTIADPDADPTEPWWLRRC